MGVPSRILGKLLVPKGPANVRLGSVSPKGRLKLKNTSNPDRRSQIAAELEEKKEKKNAARRQTQDEANTPLASLAYLDEYVRVQRVTLPNGRQREWPVISPTGTADPLMTTAVTISRWLKAGLLPNPVLATGRTLCFHKEELRSFCQILGDHLTETRHYRSSHTETKRKLFRENARIREAIFETP